MSNKSAQHNVPMRFEQPLNDLGQAVKGNPTSPKDLADASGIPYDPNNTDNQDQFAAGLPILIDQHSEGIKSNEEILEDQKKIEQGLINMRDIRQNLNTVSSKKSFNLKKAQLSPMDQNMGDFHEVGQMDEPELQQHNTPQFQDQNELKDFLVSNIGNPEEIRQLIFNNADDNSLDNIKMALDNFFSKASIDGIGSKELLDAANIVYEVMPESMKAVNPDGQQTILTERGSPDNMQANVNTCLEKVSNYIKQLAEKYVSSLQKESKGSYNQKKTAQHKTVDNMLLWGPGNLRPDPFLRGQPVSDWHIVERNKGFGQDIDGVWNIDWEAMWRGNVMDKYSRPYRDKEGNWVGGYLEKRFEVDKNIPEANNYQLKPGQKRRPYLPEYGSTEARLEAARKKNKEGGKTEEWDKSKFSKMSGSKFNLKKTAFLDNMDNGHEFVPNEKDEQDFNEYWDERTKQRPEWDNTDVMQMAKSLFSQGTHPDEVSDPLLKDALKSVWLANIVQNKAASSDKKKSEVKESQIGSGIGGGRPAKDPFAITLPGEEIKDMSPQKACSVCGRHCSKTDAKCPYCNGLVVDIGVKATKPADPGAQKPHNEYLNQNMPVTASEVIYDSRSGKFTIAQVGIVNPGDAQLRRFRGRKKGYPLTDKDGKPVKPLPQLNDFVGKDFETSKDMADPNDPDYWKTKSNDDKKCRPNQDEINHSCTSLAIDG